MSLEDGRSSGSVEAESAASDQNPDHNQVQNHVPNRSPSRGTGLEQCCRKSPKEDEIVLHRIASMSSLDSFDPSDFTGRFTKFQSRSKKRSRIIGGKGLISYILLLQRTHNMYVKLLKG